MARRLAAAILAAAWAAPAPAADLALGTLFHTPEERARLDRLRRGEAEPERMAEPGGRAQALTGFVQRSDGRHTVWIDGSPVTVRGPQAENVLDPRAVRAYSDRQDDALKIERKSPR